MILEALALAATPGHSRQPPVITPPPLVRVQPPPQDPTTPFSTVEGWTINIDPTIGAGCFLYTSYIEGTQLRLGFDQIRGNAHILVGNPAWQTLRQGQSYRLNMTIDSRQAWWADASGFRFPSGGMVYLNIVFTRPEFMSEFMAGNILTITYEGRLVAQLQLDGAAAAGRELLRCQQANPRSDPFQGPAATPDPFHL